MLDLNNWARLLHFLGLFLWVGGLLSVTYMLSRAGTLSKDAIGKLVEVAAGVERAVLLPGFVLAFLSGIYLLVVANLPDAPLKQPWMHIKLTVVFLGLLGVQGALGAKRKALRTGGDPQKLSGTFRMLFVATILLALVVLFLVETHPLNRVIL